MASVKGLSEFHVAGIEKEKSGMQLRWYVLEGKGQRTGTQEERSKNIPSYKNRPYRKRKT